MVLTYYKQYTTNDETYKALEPFQRIKDNKLNHKFCVPTLKSVDVTTRLIMTMK
jgi:hypothetical protein